MKLSAFQKTGKFKDLIQQQKANNQSEQSQQKFDILAYLKAAKIQKDIEQNEAQIRINKLNLPKLMKRIYSEKKLSVKEQQKTENTENQELNLTKYKLKAKKQKTNFDSLLPPKPQLVQVSSTDRFSTDRDIMNYTFGSKFRLRGANFSSINTSAEQKKSSSQSSRVMSNSQKRLINKIFQ